MKSIWIVSAKRTPIGRFGGSFRGFSAVDLGVMAAEKAIEESGISKKDIALSVFGHGRQGGSGPNPARQIAIRSGLEKSSVAYTVNQACASGLLAIKSGFNELHSTDKKAVLVGGVESMSTLPHYVFDARWGKGYGHIKGIDANFKDGFFCPLADQLMGRTAETLALEGCISRQDQEAFAVNSHKKASKATLEGLFKDETFSVTHKKGLVEVDETIRTNANASKLAKLPTVFMKEEDGGTITAGTSCSMADGGSALVMVKSSSCPKGSLAKVAGFVDVGVQPTHMGIGPVPACQKLEKTLGWKTSGYQHVEINEAFAAQVLACQATLKIDEACLNPLGGAIALGHPIGCTGARMVTTLSHSLSRLGKGSRGLATLCVSGGMGFALALEGC